MSHIASQTEDQCLDEGEMDITEMVSSDGTDPWQRKGTRRAVASRDNAKQIQTDETFKLEKTEERKGARFRVL